jgi:hypothetical protein
MTEKKWVFDLEETGSRDSNQGVREVLEGYWEDCLKDYTHHLVAHEGFTVSEEGGQLERDGKTYDVVSEEVHEEA